MAEKIKIRIIILVVISFLMFSSAVFAAKMKYGAGGFFKARAQTSLNMNFTINSEEIQTMVDPNGTVEDVLNDLNRITYSAADYVKDYQLTINDIYPTYIQVEYSSSNQAIATVDQNGRVSYVSNGTVTIYAQATTFPWLKKGVSLSVALQEGTATVSYPSYVAGSVGKDISENIDNRISGVTEANASTYKPIYSTQNHTAGVYVRNTNCWAYDLDLTAISPWNSYSANLRAGTLISPRHIVFAAHYPIPNGSTIRFVKQDNTVVERTLSNQTQVGSTDIKIGVLDSDVPAGISFAKVLPSGHASYMPGISKKKIPVLGLDQEEKALVFEIDSLSSALISYYGSNDEHRLALRESLIGGDSGNPAFLVINDELVIISTWYSIFWSPNIASYKTEINAIMTSLGGGYQLTEADLSGFTSY